MKESISLYSHNKCQNREGLELPLGGRKYGQFLMHFYAFYLSF